MKRVVERIVNGQLEDVEDDMKKNDDDENDIFDEA